MKTKEQTKDLKTSISYLDYGVGIGICTGSLASAKAAVRDCSSGFCGTSTSCYYKGLFVHRGPI